MEQGKQQTAKPYRHELKYVISEGEHRILSRRLQSALPPDKYAARNGGEYFIRSLYFDDPYDTAIAEKADGIQVRDKFRIRIYNLSDRILALHNAQLLAEPVDLDWVRAHTVIIHYCGRLKPWKPHYVGVLDVFYHELMEEIQK